MRNKFSEYLQHRKLKKRLKDLRKAAAYRFACDCDILSPEDRSFLQDTIRKIKDLGKNDFSGMSQVLEERVARIEGMNPLKSKRARSIRNFLDVLAVAFGVAFGIRALYLQPFKIPTGSMQPTLFGIHYVDRAGLEKYGSFLEKKLIPLFSPRAKLEVGRSGRISREITPVRSLFSESAIIRIGGVEYTLPGNFYANILRYADLDRPWFEKGDIVCDGWLVTGDHLFVERLSIYFRGIKHGDVAVFNTENISSPTQPMGGYYYIKRIAGLPGDTLKIDGNILKIRKKGSSEFVAASELDPGFRKTDSMKGGYHGHIADGLLAEGMEVTVPENCYFALGDNTSNSLDSRNWGFIPRRNMIGLAVNVFWPVSRRWGIVDTKPPIEELTVLPHSMQIQ